MTINYTPEIRKLLKNKKLNLEHWAFLLSLHEEYELYAEHEIEEWGFLAQNLAILGYIIYNSEESDDLFKITEKGKQLINQIINNENS